MQVFICHIFGKVYPSDVDICCTVRQEGTVSKHGKHELKASFSGKTSLINSIAGELGLDICVLIMSSKGYVYSCFYHNSVNLGNRMNDHILMTLMENVPSR
jgi:hypothetical protein